MRRAPSPRSIRGYGSASASRTVSRAARRAGPIAASAQPPPAGSTSTTPNARKYSPEHTAITVSVGAAELRGAPGVRIEVIDRGVGIAPDDRPRVFTPLFRADRSRTRATDGGAIDFHSEPDVGSRFWFVVPRFAMPTRS